MTTYNLAFSEKLAEAARLVVSDGLDSDEAMQTVLYLSLLSAEIALKALLEKAGQPIQKIRERSHDLSSLLSDLSTCKIYTDIAPGVPYWVPASNIRGQVVDSRYSNATIGTLLEAEKRGASKYPNEIRYGEQRKHFPPEVMSEMPFKILEWAKLHWDTVRLG